MKNNNIGNYFVGTLKIIAPVACFYIGIKGYENMQSVGVDNLSYTMPAMFIGLGCIGLTPKYVDSVKESFRKK